jgi:hypothetical protein
VNDTKLYNFFLSPELIRYFQNIYQPLVNSSPLRDGAKSAPPHGERLDKFHYNGSDQLQGKRQNFCPVQRKSACISQHLPMFHHTH